MRRERIIVQRCIPARLEATQAANDSGLSRQTHDEYGSCVLRQGARCPDSGQGLAEAFAGQVLSVNPSGVHDGAPLGGPRA